MDNNRDTDNLITSIVEDGMNSSYIDSLLIALFYKDNKNLSSILDLKPNKPCGIYLQELIKEKFIEPLQRNFSVSASTINEIRNYSIICGYKLNDIIIEQNIAQYYNFLVELLNIDKISINIEKIKDNNIINSNLMSFNYLTFKPRFDTSIKKLMLNWINNSILNNLEIDDNCNIYNIYSLNVIPNYIAIYIDRFENENKNRFKIDIMKRIKFFNNNLNSQNYLKWSLNSIICHSGTSIDSGYYYSVLYHDKNPIIFCDKYFPSFEQININDDEIKDNIMSECVLLIYSLNS
jgi:hypothetical protein